MIEQRLTHDTVRQALVAEKLTFCETSGTQWPDLKRRGTAIQDEFAKQRRHGRRQLESMPAKSHSTKQPFDSGQLV
jgi:hypothetical protein